MSKWLLYLLPLFFISVTSVGNAFAFENIEWISQFGTAGADITVGIDIDSNNNVYVIGKASHPGGVHGPDFSSFITKYKPDGQQEWFDNFGANTGINYPIGIAIDSHDNVYVAGFAGGQFPNEAGTGSGYLVKYEPNGQQVWLKRFAINPTQLYLSSSDVIYVIGIANYQQNQPYFGGTDGAAVKFRSNGQQLWLKRFGTDDNDQPLGIRVDSSNNVYVTGFTSGQFPNQVSLGGEDTFLAKFQPNGNLDWLVQFGTGKNDMPISIDIDSNNNAYVSGRMLPMGQSPSNGDYSGFLTKFDVTGQTLWSRQISTTGSDYVMFMKIDSSDSVYVSGITTGLVGSTQFGATDAFLIKYNSNGNIDWVKQFGTNMHEEVAALTMNYFDDVYVTGDTYGTMGQYFGIEDRYLVRYDKYGSHQTVTQFGTDEHDEFHFFSINNALVSDENCIYTGGFTRGTFPDQIQVGDYDGFVAKICSYDHSDYYPVKFHCGNPSNKSGPDVSIYVKDPPLETASYRTAIDVYSNQKQNVEWHAVFSWPESTRGEYSGFVLDAEQSHEIDCQEIRSKYPGISNFSEDFLKGFVIISGTDLDVTATYTQKEMPKGWSLFGNSQGDVEIDVETIEPKLDPRSLEE